MQKFSIAMCVSVSILPLCAGVGFAETSTAELLQVVKAVGPEGKGHAAATRAIRELATRDADALPEILAAMNGTGPLAANWLRSAFESIADRALKSNGQLPQQKLEAIVIDTQHDPRARRLAYEWLEKVDPQLSDRLIPGMLTDPSAEFRRDAVARLLTQAEQLKENGQAEDAAKIYRTALTGAVHKDQVEAIVGPLKDLGQSVNLQRHFGFLTRWQMIGPFDNRDRKGFAAEYPPEVEVDLNATLPGQLGDVKWQPVATDDDYGVINIAEQIAPYKGACMYAVTEFVSRQRQDVQFRMGTPNAWKIWLNGKLLFAREEYHRGMALDQYRVDATLERGKNQILLKICQNEQDDNWAQRYQFQLRVCDMAGHAVLSETEVQTSQIGPSK